MLFDIILQYRMEQTVINIERNTFNPKQKKASFDALCYEITLLSNFDNQYKSVVCLSA